MIRLHDLYRWPMRAVWGVGISVLALLPWSAEKPGEMAVLLAVFEPL